MGHQDGLEWESTTFGLTPRWTEEPQVSAIGAVLKMALGSDQDCEVTFFTQGGFNKLDKIRHRDESLVMRISLPVDPHYKTESEVATLNYMRKINNIPVPEVKAYSSSSSNPIGFEWILMDFTPGTPLREKWREISWTAKEALVKQLAQYSASMYDTRFDAIGNIYPQALPNRVTVPRVGRIVSTRFFWGARPSQQVSRGPFNSSQEWCAARLSLIEANCRQVLKESNDKDDREDSEVTLKIIERLWKHLSAFFPKTSEKLTILFHDDLSSQNILVDDNGKLTAVVDWECVSALPMWKACHYPALLVERARREKPNQDQYAKEENGEVVELFWQHLLEYEKTLLRECFLAEMRKLRPEWISVFASSQNQRDFDTAVDGCDSEFCFRRINKWLDGVENTGPQFCLTESLLQ